MTAVASPPSVQPLLPWNSGDAVDSLNSISAEDVSHILIPRKSSQKETSNSFSSNPSASAPILSPPMSAPQINGETHAMNGDASGAGPRKKPARGLWPSSKAEPISAISTARPQSVSTSSSGQSASATMTSAINPITTNLPPQPRPQPSPSSQNSTRVETPIASGEATAILALLPMTGTFERKQINVPFFPDTLRIGRQTNAKTIPTAVNGYFDSKVLSRQHAEVWADRNGKIWIRDVKSSNGTFVNGIRLSPENRDSEPHELREHDTLELGIDIVSEDQKSIVHHKVSAKIELAGIYSSAPALLDMMHVDPNTGQQYPTESAGQPLSQVRGRGGQNSLANNNRIPGAPNLAGINGNMNGAQRQMNIWMAPITIEQVVRKLTTELKQAKQQSFDLHRTSDFFNTLMNLESGQEPPKSSDLFAQEHATGNNPPAPVDPASSEAISPFSQPPAPPPQQPLPEKPDSSRSIGEPGIRRADTEKPKFFSSSPDFPEPQNGQVFSLIEALKTATQESDSQGDRIKYLEAALKRERKARELAERRASALSNGSLPAKDLNREEFGESDDTAPPLDSVELMQQDLPNGHIEQDKDGMILKPSMSVETLKGHQSESEQQEDQVSSTSRLQARLDLMVKEMSEMKLVMESYKRRAEEAEEGRRTLAEMVDNIRAGREPQSVPPTFDKEATSFGTNELVTSATRGKTLLRHGEETNGSWRAFTRRELPNGNAGPNDMHDELERTFSNVLQKQRFQIGDQGRMAQSVPYVSMLGVVIIGVGIMTWLNGWQPGGDR